MDKTSASGAEDYWFVFAPAAVSLYRPTGDSAEAFCVETVAHDAPAAYHKPWPYNDAAFMAKVYARMLRVAEAAARGDF